MFQFITAHTSFKEIINQLVDKPVEWDQLLMDCHGDMDEANKKEFEPVIKQMVSARQRSAAEKKNKELTQALFA